MPNVSDSNRELTLQLYANPLRLQDKLLTLFENYIFDGRQVKDGNNIFTFGLEMESALVASVVNEMSGVFESLYPSRARTMQDLYRHLSDYDYVGIYATPASCEVCLMFDRDWVIDNAIPLDDESRQSMIVLPRHTSFHIGDYEFGIYYPIQILIRKRYHEDGSVDYDNTLVHCQWDTTITNPLYKVRTNVIEHRFSQSRNSTYLCINIPVHQFKVDIQKRDAVSSTGYLQRYDYTDKFYAVRVFHWKNKSWKEMTITLSDVVYNTRTPTAKVHVLKDLGQVEVSIPQVYFSNGDIGNKIMVMIYTTKGEMNLDARSYSANQYNVSFLMDDEVVDPTYSSVLKRIPTLDVYPITTRVSGGSNGRSVADMQSIVAAGFGADEVLSTTQQLKAYAKDLGFEAVKYLDNITDRIWLLKKQLTDTESNTIPAGLYKATLDTETLTHYEDFDSLLHTDNDQYVLLPNSLFKYDKDTDSMKLLTKAQKRVLTDLQVQDRINELNSNVYLRTPFHVVLHTSETSPTCTVYNFFDPVITSTTFLTDNPHTATQVSAYAISAIPLEDGQSGWRVLVKLYKTADLLNTPAAVTGYPIQQHIKAALACDGEGDERIYVESTYLDSEDGYDVLAFDIITDYGVTSTGYVKSDSVRTFTNTSKYVPKAHVPLNGEWILYFYVRKDHIEEEDAHGYAPYDIPDTYKQLNMVFVSSQKITMRLGESIPGLRSNLFSTINGAEYESYKTTTFAAYGHDVYARWEEDVTETLANGTVIRHFKGDVKSAIGPSGKQELVLEHNAGDLMLSPEKETSEVKTVAMNVKDENGPHVLYLSANDISTNASYTNKFVPYYMDIDPATGLITPTPVEKSPAITEYYTVEMADLLETALNTIGNMQYAKPSDVSRTLVKTEDSYEFVFKDGFAPTPFVYVRNAESDGLPDAKVNVYAVKKTAASGNLVQGYDTCPGSEHDGIWNDYYSTIDDYGNVTPGNKNELAYGAVYMLDPDVMMFRHTTYITAEDLYKFYSEYDEGVDNGETGVSSKLLAKYNLSSGEADKLLRLRFPWKRLVCCGQLEILKMYRDSRSLMNFRAGLVLSGQEGLRAMSYLQSLFIGSSHMVERTNATEAIAEANQVKNQGKLIWCENWTLDQDDTYCGYNKDTITKEFIPLINGGTIGSNGAVLLNNGQPNEHVVVAVAPTFDSIRNLVLSFSTMSGTCWICRRHTTANLRNKLSELKDSSGEPLQRTDLNQTVYYANEAILGPTEWWMYQIVNDNVDLNQNSYTDVQNWPWEMDGWMTNEGTKPGVVLTLNESASFTKIVHKIGDTILDSYGRPAKLKERELIYGLELVFYDARPGWVTDDSVQGYDENIRALVWSHSKTADNARPRLLERTRLYYAPIQTIGLGDFKADNGETMSRNVSIGMGFKLYVGPSIIQSLKDQNIIRNNILSIVRKHIDTGNVNCVDIADEIRDTMGDRIKYVDSLGIDGDPLLQTLLAADSSICLPYLRTLLALQDNGTVTMRPDLTLEWSLTL